MNRKIAICAEHGIGYAEQDGQLYILEVFGMNGRAYAQWIECPATVRELVIWLGY